MSFSSARFSASGLKQRRGVYQPKQGKIVSSTGEITVDETLPYAEKQVEISLRNSGKGKLRINALDVNGAVLAPVPFRETDGVVTFTTDTGAYGAMAYEFIRE